MSESAQKGIYPSWKLGAYAAPSIPIAAIGIPMVAYLPTYYATEFGLSLTLIGTIFLIVRLADIALDPVAGSLMDRNRTRFGRFRPWLLGGTLPMAVSAYMLFNPGESADLTFLTVWLSVAYLAYSFCYLSHLSWGMSLSNDYSERSRVFGFWQAGNLIGMIVVLGLPILVEGVFGQSHVVAIQSMGIFIAISTIIGVVIALAFVPEPKAASDRQSTSVREYLGLMIRPTIARLLVADLFIGTALGMNSALFFFYFGFVKGFAQLDIVILLFINLCGSLCGTPIWTYLTTKMGKHKAAAVAFTFYALSLIVIQLTPAIMLLNVLILFLAGLTLSAGPLLLRSMLADAGDEELLRSGIDQTGILSALFTGTNKVGLAIAPGFSFMILGFFQFDAMSGENTSTALWALTALYILAPGILGGIVALVIRNHPLTAERHAEILEKLKQQGDLEEKHEHPDVPLGSLEPST